MSENIDNDPAVEDAPVAETAPVTEPEVETEPVEEPAPIVEAPKVTAPVVDSGAGSLADKKGSVVIFASREVKLNKLGKTLPAGFNSVPFEEARAWLTLGSVRPATPEETAKELGK